MASDQSAKRVLIDLGFKRTTLLQKPSIIDCALGTRENCTSEQPYPQVDSSLSVFAASWRPHPLARKEDRKEVRKEPQAPSSELKLLEVFK
jgi:hypothetical protein